jgi:hypothetical protein
VAVSRNPGIYTSWPAAQAEVVHFGGAVHQGFPSYKDALQFLTDHARTIPTRRRTHVNNKQPPATLEKVRDPTKPSQAKPPRGQTNPSETTVAAVSEDGSHITLPESGQDLVNTATKFHILARVAHTPSIIADLDEEVLYDIFTTTFAHHLLRLPNNLLTFRVGLIQYCSTGCFNSRQRNRWAHFYHLILIGEHDSPDIVDNGINTNQCLTFALQKWHLYKNTQFNIGGSLRDFLDISPPSTNPWVLLPAVNSSKDTALGCLLGVSPELFGGSRRAIIDIMSVIFHHVRFFLGTIALSHHLDNWNIFQEFFGLQKINTPANPPAFSSSAVFATKRGDPFMTPQPRLAHLISTVFGRRFPISPRMR